MLQNLRLVILSIVVISTQLVAQPPIEFVRTYEFEGVVEFYDIYTVSNGDYAVCGNSLGGRNAGDMMVVGRLDSGGGLIWSWTNGDRFNDYTALTIIETDNGSFLTGGYSHNNDNRVWRFVVALIDGEGETIWTRDYGMGRCYAVIELKSGEYMLAGRSEDEALLILIDDEGEVIWQETYNNDDNDRFVAIRETEGGVVASGRFAVWVVKVDLENGELIWSRSHNSNARYCNDMTSTVDGGFVMALTRSGGNLGLFKVDEDGEEVWNRSYELEGNNNPNFAAGVTRLDDGGFAIVGRRIDNGDRPIMVRTNSRGNEIWIQTYYLEEWEEFEGPGFFYGVTRGLDGSIIAAGWAVMTDDNPRVDALLMKLEPYIPEPIIFDWSPEDTVFSVLPGDTVTFMAVARDQQGDELSNQWIFDADSLGTDTVQTVIFEELGEHYVQCQITDGEFTSAVRWHVTAEEFYIDSYSPDSLTWTIQRDREIDFSLDVRAIEDLDPNYRWILNDRGRHQIDIGEGNSVTHHFDLAGEISLEGRVYHEGIEHSVFWRISVRSLLYWWTPHEREFTIPIGEPLEFTVIPFEPMPDSLEFLWFIDGVDEEIYDVGLYHTFRDTGSHTVTSIVYVGAEADTVVWTVRVFDPNAVGDDPASLLPSEVTLYPAAPNPFNSIIKIGFYLPNADNTSLRIFNIGGRVVADILTRQLMQGKHELTWQAEAFPDGVYFIMLKSNNFTQTQKIVLLK